MRSLFFVFLMCICGVAAAQQCGYVDGQYKCTNPPNCGYVNGLWECVGSGGSSSGASSGGGSVSGNSGVTLGTQSKGGGENYGGITLSGSVTGGNLTINGAIKTGLGPIISHFANWLLGILEFIPEWIWSQLLGAIVYVVSLLPVPPQIQTFISNIGQIPSGVLWFLEIMEFSAGLQMVVAAISLRFLMTWIPFAGPKA